MILAAGPQICLLYTSDAADEGKGGLGNLARIVDTSDLPAHPEFSDAWEMDANSITVNMDKAKEITKVRLRNERAPLLAAQDVLFMKAQETGADTTAIVAEKNRLRDITTDC